MKNWILIKSKDEFRIEKNQQIIATTKSDLTIEKYFVIAYQLTQNSWLLIPKEST